jgi:hypothetical protein
VAVGEQRQVDDFESAVAGQRAEKRREIPAQLPDGRADDGVHFGHRNTGTHEARRPAGGFEDAVHHQLQRGAVFVYLGAEHQQPPRDHLGAVSGSGRAGVLGQQQGAGPQVGPPAGRYPRHGGDRAGRPQLGGQTIEKYRQPAKRRLGEYGGDELRRCGDQFVVDPPPAGDGQFPQPGPAPGEQVGSGRRDGRAAVGRQVRGPHRAATPERGVEAGEQRIVHRPEQRGPAAGERRQMLVGDRARHDLLGRLGQPAGQGRTGEGGGECRQRGRPRLVHAGEAVHQAAVDAGHQIERVRHARRGSVDQLGKLGRQHHRGPPAGNQRSSGIGSVVAGTSR